MTFGLRCYSPACPCIRPRYSFVFLRPRVRFRFFRPAPYGLGLTFRYGWRHRLRRAPFIPLVHNTCQAHEHTRPRVWFPAPSPETSSRAAPHHLGDTPCISLMIGDGGRNETLLRTAGRNPTLTPAKQNVIYLDHNATTPIAPEVLEAACHWTATACPSPIAPHSNL